MITLHCCFVGSEAAALHGISYAVSHCESYVTLSPDELQSQIPYYQSHGYKLLFATTNRKDYIQNRAFWL